MAMIGVLGGLLLEPASALIVGADQDDHSVMHLERAPMLESVGQVGTRRSGSAVYLGKGVDHHRQPRIRWAQ